MKLAKRLGYYSLAMVSTIVVLTTSCEEQKHIPSISLEKVSTNPVKTAASQTLYPVSTVVTLEGKIQNTGGTPVLRRGACYVVASYHKSSGKIEPTINNVTIVDQNPNSTTFTISLDLAQAGSTYYIRLFATNSIGTVYSDIITLQTEVAKGEQGDRAPDGPQGPIGPIGAAGSNSEVLITKEEVTKEEAVAKLPKLSQPAREGNGNSISFTYKDDKTNPSEEVEVMVFFAKTSDMPNTRSVAEDAQALWNDNTEAIGTSRHKIKVIKFDLIKNNRGNQIISFSSANDLTQATEYRILYLATRYKNKSSIPFKLYRSDTNYMNTLREQVFTIN